MDMFWINKARDFANSAHGTQTRKYTGVPYWHHLQEVAQTLLRYSASPQLVAAGWLHDVLEDTSVTYEMLQDEFDMVIAHLVLEVTDVSRPAHGKRPFRKRLDRQYLAGASAYGQMIKCADIISNTRDIVANDLRFARGCYVAEKVALIDVLSNARMLSYPLWKAAYDVVEQAKMEVERAAAE
ncbi:HD domain-containing protein [Bradyrhizobium sp. SZCCHNS3053]|uniref:HD domain-containing protein n=1 Tax=Bradyrhizobium sp. SZCCHNS3053 TaxID=3057322 RepID=UPI002915F4C1|nr:HD domain-containing protein [Bradyrhizobium sp. SZCCHNS3053]